MRNEVFGDDIYVVVDHYHVIQALSEQANEVRKCLHKKHLKKGDLKELRSAVSVYKKNAEDLTDDERILLARYFQTLPELELAYELKEAFRAIYRLKSREEAEAAYNRWVDRIPKDKAFAGFRSFKGTVERCRLEFDLSRADTKNI